MAKFRSIAGDVVDAMRFEDADGDAIRIAELTGDAAEVDYVGAELRPVLQLGAPGARAAELELGEWVVRDATGWLSVVPDQAFARTYEPYADVAPSAPPRGLIPTPPLDVDHALSYHEGHPEDGPKYDALRAAAKHFARALLEHTPPGADQAAAFRKIREALMTAVAAVVLGRPAPAPNAPPEAA